MGNKLLLFKNVTFFLIAGIFLSGMMTYGQEDPKELYQQASMNLELGQYRSATVQLKKLYQQNYCHKNAVRLMLSYALAMDDKRPAAVSYIQTVDKSLFSTEVKAFSNTLEAFIKGEGPNFSANQYQKLLDYINPPIHGESQHLNDREKERLLIQREYIRRYFESGYELLQRGLSNTDLYDGYDNGSSDSGWGMEIYVPTEEELEAASRSEWEAGDIGYYDTETFDMDLSNYQWDADIDTLASTSTNGIIDQLSALFDDC